MISEDHPFHYLEPLRRKDGVVFRLSRYVYIPDNPTDSREDFELSGHEFSEERIRHELSSLQAEQELALHSRLTVNGKTFHIPMIDFSIEDMDRGIVFDRMRRYLPQEIVSDMAVFSSGRSFHAYSNALLRPGKWIKFMGRLLLLNPRGQKEIVDSRWVGHRLVGGFGSLRWSNNSGMYLSVPTRASFSSTEI